MMGIAVLLLIVQIIRTFSSTIDLRPANGAVFLVFLILVALMPFCPGIACTTIALLWSASQFIPGFEGSPYLFTVYSAVALLFANYSLRLALPVITAMMISFCAQYILATNIGISRGNANSSEILLVALGLLIASVLGSSIKQVSTNAWIRETEMQRARERERTDRMRRDAQIASQLHDGLTNDLSYLITVAHSEMSAATDEQHRNTWQAIIARTDDAFGKAHEVIDMLDRVSIEDESAHCPNSMVTISGREAAHQLDSALKSGMQQLKSLGYQGSASIESPVIPTIAENVANESLWLVNEIFANIRRHCDPSEDYSVIITADDEKITIAAMNTMTHSQYHRIFAVSGRGLAMHQRTIESLHGSLRKGLADGIWSLHAEIPLEQHENNTGSL
jgi:hypothetical protein